MLQGAVGVQRPRTVGFVLVQEVTRRGRVRTLAATRARGEPTIPTMIGLEKATSPFLRAADPALRRRLGALAPDLLLTLDPGEFRGFEYHSGISYTLFARNVRGELGRGGRYVTPGGETATGFTLYLDSVMRGLPPMPPKQMVYLPDGTAHAVSARLRAEGHSTWAALEPEGDNGAKAAKSANCSHWWDGAAVRPV